MKIHQYKNYEEYVYYQKKGNKDKSDGQWAKKDEIRFLSDYLQRILGNVETGICHGTRQGNEQKWFSEFTGAKVIGTEISDTAEKYPNTIQWDFHDVKPEWLDAMDFVYSNALDHSYDPIKCLKAWASCLKDTGLCILEWTIAHTAKYTSMIDPFGATFDEYKKLIADCGLKLDTILNYKSPGSIEKTFFIIKR